MNEEEQRYGTLAEAIAGHIDNLLGPSPLGESVVTFWELVIVGTEKGFETGRAGRQLTEDEILVMPEFVAARNGVPAVAAVMTEDGGFDLFVLQVGDPE